ncbi:hypothetical protein BDZ45DRAFT_590135, partial [Acephala macrosclerotiorum]
RKFLTVYSKAPDEKIPSLVYEMRDKAWAIRSYPCIGQGLFLKPLITTSPAYPEILKRLKAGERLLELGSFIGHDMRRLVSKQKYSPFDGAPLGNFYAVDIVNHWDVGCDMFSDRQTLSAHFIEADILHPKCL